jgi:Acyl-CoA dehydrogenase, C-terminal domain
VIGSAERELLASTFEDALAMASGPGAADAVLSDLGWLDLLAAEADDALAVVFTALGRTNRVASALDDVVLRALGFTPHPALAAVLPPFGRWNPPGRIAAEQCQASGVATARAATADELLVVCGTGWEVGVVTAPRASLDVQPAGGVDPAGAWQLVHGEHRVTVDVGPKSDFWPRAVALARRAVGHQLAGACRSMLDLARQHAIDRVQFGRPIASFQAVRHRLADVLVAIEALEATLDAAADDPGPETAALA